MELVINIDENVYEEVKQYVEKGIFDYNGINAKLHKSVAHGIPIPKGYGNLIDVDELEKALLTDDMEDFVDDEAKEIDESIFCYVESAVIAMEKEKFDKYIQDNFIQGE